MKIIIKDLIDIYKEFYRMRRGLWSELCFIVGVPIALSVTAFIIGLYVPKRWEISIISIMDDFLNQIITVLALFISFSIAYIGMIITSESSNITKMKETESRLYKLNDKPVTIFQSLHCLMTYTVVVEVVFLMIVFAEKLLIYLIGKSIIEILFCFNLVILLHIVILICIQIKDIYYSFWKSQ